MHNDIMVARSKDRPPMLAIGRYAHLPSRFMRYVDTKPNMKELKKCIFNGPYVMTRFLVPTKPATKIDPPVPEHTIQETYENTLPKNRAYINVEAEAIHMILSGIRDEIYSTDVKTNLFWEFGKFSSRDRESIVSYYSRFYKMMNKMIGNQLEVATMQVNVQFLQQLQPEWLRFVTVVKRDPEQAWRDKDMQKSIALIAKYFTKIYKPTNNNNRTSSNSRNKNVDSNPRTEYGHFAKEWRKPKRVKDYSYHKEKMMLCKQEDKGVPLSADQGDWLDDTDEELDEQELEAYYMYMAKIQEVLHVTDDNSGPTYDTEPLEQVQTDNEYNVFAKDKQHSKKPESINDTNVMEIVDNNVILITQI
nr:hypothetical protein [Tanacetum cinerariifolium]